MNAVPDALEAAAAPAGTAGAARAAAAFAALGDAVAALDAGRRRVAWASPGWLRLLPALGEGTPLVDLEHALPGLAAALRAQPAATPAAAAAAQRLVLGDAQEWQAELSAPVEGGLRLLRLADRREQGRALQRQLDAREQLLFTSRVLSVGEMATTLAHEINQPIGACANLLRGLRSRLARRASGRLQEAEAQALDRAIDQAMFAARIVARIREFTHSHQPRRARLDLNRLLRASAALLDWDLQRSNARLELALPDGEAPVCGDEVMLQQVVVNLMRNALDALRTDPPPQPRLALRLLRHHGELELQVSDNGCGLDDEAQARLFVPFASTKPSGMGIGLSICRSFIELHQGRLWFSRNPERGTTFHVGLPRAAQADAPSR
ncbi:sensor histidine kinase [Azohydromonas aeria]|uniref:sensor histidine kinase n=1 Tax=Azohydromonas aeria TaxID=2590212 RepID=UPI0012FA34A7|nr:ATP-binding protein [Azohydromonas aeria]